MIRYTTVAGRASAEQIIERSRFIAQVAGVESREEADAFIAEVRGRFRDATHNVPAFIVGEKQELMWASDDGEPQGTSGPPVLQMIAREGLTNLCVVVTRYFGGVKLGTGGLVRAYTSSAKLALEAAGLHQVKDMCLLEFRLPYHLLGKLQNMEKDKPFVIEDTVYEELLRLRLSYEPENEMLVKGLLFELTSGNLELLSEEQKIL